MEELVVRLIFADHQIAMFIVYPVAVDVVKNSILW